MKTLIYSVCKETTTRHKYMTKNTMDGRYTANFLGIFTKVPYMKTLSFNV